MNIDHKLFSYSSHIGELFAPDTIVYASIVIDRISIRCWNGAIDEALKYIVTDGNPDVARKKVEALKYVAK